MIRISKKHDFGGVSYSVSSAKELSGLPSEFRELVSDRDIAALNDHGAYFSTLANMCRFGPMRSWLTLVAQSESVSLTAYKDDMGQRASLLNTLGGSVCLTPSLVPELAATQLRDVFGLIGSIHQFGFGEPHVLEIGQHAAVEKFNERMLEHSSGPPPKSYVIEFYRSECGESLLAVGDQVYHYHISGAVCRGTSLDETLRQYFDERSGQESLFEPHVPYDSVKRKVP